MTYSHNLDPNSIRAYRYRVHALSQELWHENNQLKRLNIALQLADATTHLARMEAQELQTQYRDQFSQILNKEDHQDQAISSGKIQLTSSQIAEVI